MGEQVWSLHSVALNRDQEASSNCAGFHEKMLPGQA